MRSGGGLFFFSIFLLIAIFSTIQDKKISHKNIVVEKKTETHVKDFTIQYNVAYGSVYTGDQSPIIYTGNCIVSTNEYGDVGGNGLPVSEWAPQATKFSFTMGEKKALLRILSKSNNEEGLLEIENQSNRILMSVDIQKNNDRRFTISAKPFVKS